MNSIESFNKLDSVPVVTFDVGLGAKTEYIDFDYAAYDTYVRSKGLSDEQIDALSLHFYPQNEQFHLIGGEYQHTTNKASVGITSDKSAIAVNRALLHENEHMVSHIMGRVTPQERRHKEITRVSWAAANAAGITALGTEVFAFIAQSAEAAVTGGEVAALGVVAFIGSVLSYVTDEDEIRARMAESAPDAPMIVTYTAKPQGQNAVDGLPRHTLSIPFPKGQRLRITYRNPFAKNSSDQ
ncbi:MAG TPA: hypothetical protein VLG11_01920 [Candidatus Saccharimonadales bacterium]|nr:hypothetical protein [Candidatus Saccharimonadales bacterium]